MSFGRHHRRRRQGGRDSRPWVALHQCDFRDGTVVLRSNTRYYLAENIVCDFQSQNDYQPQQSQFWPHGPYRSRQALELGFTTAVQIGDNCHNVELDGRGCWIRQSDRMALQQRFFSLVQLGGTPFIDEAGPIDFVADRERFGSAHRVHIHHVRFGLTSHHAVQGNQPSDLLVEHCEFRQFEVAAISLNAPRGVVMRDLHIGESRQRVPVNARYSQSRFLRVPLQLVCQNPDVSEDVKREAIWHLGRLQCEMRVAEEAVLANQWSMIPALYRNDQLLADGAQFAIVVHGRGPAVNDFSPMPTAGALVDESSVARDVRIQRVVVDDVKSAARQFVAVTAAAPASSASGVYGNGVQHDSVGGVFDLATVWDRSNDEYRGNVLSDAQVFLATPQCMSLLPERYRRRQTIGAAMVEWARSSASSFQAAVQPANGRRLLPLMARDSLYFSYNGDAMSHVMKGMVAVRLDRVVQGVVQQVCLKHVHNLAPMAYTVDGSTYSVSHPNQTQPGGYQGCCLRGISLSACESMRLFDIELHDLYSLAGSVFGVDLLNQNNGVELRHIESAEALSSGEPGAPVQLIRGHVQRQHTCPTYRIRPAGAAACPMAAAVCAEASDSEEEVEDGNSHCSIDDSRPPPSSCDDSSASVVSSADCDSIESASIGSCVSSDDVNRWCQSHNLQRPRSQCTESTQRMLRTIALVLLVLVVVLAVLRYRRRQ
jgi:hypothetical protein